ncbi:MAG: STAS/SEC14 domain-containing protein [Gammaproteobacteria bacterium]|nr:STAS/SEC14 domain-containing protein [Gammaproteobacteria bacterium]
MIKLELMEETGIAVVQPQGKLEANDFEQIAVNLDPYIESHGKLKGLMIKAQTFPGWENLSTMIKHIRFVRDHQKYIERVAMVSDDDLVQILPDIVSHFVNAGLRTFEYQQASQAMAWLQRKMEE